MIPHRTGREVSRVRLSPLRANFALNVHSSSSRPPRSGEPGPRATRSDAPGSRVDGGQRSWNMRALIRAMFVSHSRSLTGADVRNKKGNVVDQQNVVANDY